jgi:cyclophilin family peptidyl-prolyl cis-trans isomerase
MNRVITQHHKHYQKALNIMNMKKHIFWLAFLLLAVMGCNNDPYTYAVIETEFGDMKVKLYNTTPLHRDNFIKLANEGFYDGLLFHRVINNFMIQGGDPDSRTATPEQPLGMGGPGYRVDAEIGALHLKGALAAARDGNPEKRSSGSQFYIVHGRPVTDDELNQVEQFKNMTYTPEQRQLYKELGGYPSLDNDYTVFGEVIEGLDVIDRIAAVPTGQGNRPVQDVRMNVQVLK